jgi:hypothetical protein
MSIRMQKVLESKRASRKELAGLPFARKLELLEKLRDRSLLIASSSLRQRQHSRPKGG